MKERVCYMEEYICAFKDFPPDCIWQDRGRWIVITRGEAPLATFSADRVVWVGAHDEGAAE